MKAGKQVDRLFSIARCQSCGFGFVVDPLEDLSAVYDEDYYMGCGADPLVDYVGELEHPETSIRTYEWRGISRVVETLRAPTGVPRWLDYACGNGGLVRYVRDHRKADIVGFDEGWIVERARAVGVPIIDAGTLDTLAGTFDIVSAIEVIEHVPDPHEFLGKVRSLLRPGGLFFYTTGNAAPVRDLPNWRYVTPEIHVSFFEPRTLSRLLGEHGFRAESRGFLAGHEDIIRFKVLKNLGSRSISVSEGMVPWPLIARLVDLHFQITAHPVGIAI